MNRKHQNPQVFTAIELKNWDVDTELFPGCWHPARPVDFGAPLHPEVLKERFRLAWKVLIGRYDVVDWFPPVEKYINLWPRKTTKTVGVVLPSA